MLNQMRAARHSHNHQPHISSHNQQCAAAIPAATIILPAFHGTSMSCVKVCEKCSRMSLLSPNQMEITPRRGKYTTRQGAALHAALYARAS